MNFVLLLLLALLLPGAPSAQTPAALTPAADSPATPGPMAPSPAARVRTAPWDPAVVEAMASLPVQHEGRVKAFVSLAAFSLYFVHGRRDMKLDRDGDGSEETTLTPTEWLLDVWCFPEQAADYPLFRIENVQVLDAIGIEHHGQRLRFDFVSYKQMLAGSGDGRSPAEQLITLANDYRHIEANKRSPVQQHIVLSAQQLNAYHALHQQLQVLHSPFALRGDALRALFAAPAEAPPATVTFTQLLAQAPAFAAWLRKYENNRNDPAVGNAFDLYGVLAAVVERSGGPALFPPAAAGAAGETWRGLDGAIELAFSEQPDAAMTAALGSLQSALTATADSDRNAALLAFRGAVVDRAKARGEYRLVGLEAYYQAASWHYRALHWFLFALVVVAAGWLWPRLRLLWGGGLGLSVVSLGFLVTDIVLRCLIKQRPPITNLYDTFLFIGGVGVLAALVVEVIMRRRIALAAAPVFGALMITLARKFEIEDGKDTLAPLQAVLDTNYYLATHVTSINMGYAAGMLAALLGTIALCVRAIGVRDAAFNKSIVRMTYGVTCFGLIFAVFGTIYGGVWANDSWGRFWGWDPKENGALMICLAQISLLHARMSGLVRDIGFCVCAGLTGIVVAFSWFHVNVLGVGLHSYGFASGIKEALLTYYWIQGGLIAVGGVGAWLRSRAAPVAEPVAQTASL